MKYPVSKPSITSLEVDYVHKAVSSTWVSSKGEFIQAFEDSFARFNNKRFGVACSSGTTALHLALKALGIGPGDEVIVPEFTMIASAWAVSYTGAKPVFVDCTGNLNIDPSLIEQKITPRTKAIMPVHIYGRKCDMRSILAIAKEHKLFVVEDCAESHGIIPEGDIACYSFFGNKIITTGEGGMCVTDNEEVQKSLELLRSMYFDPSHTFLHPKMGYNFRMTNMQAALGFAQVQRLPEILAKRQEIENWYNQYIMHEVRMPKRDVLWMYDINCGDHRDLVHKNLAEQGIETRFFFKPMSMQPMYLNGHSYLNATQWSMRGLYLPTYNDLTEQDVCEIAFAVNNILRPYGLSSKLTS